MDYYWGSSFIVGLEVGGIIDLGVGSGTCTVQFYCMSGQIRILLLTSKHG